MYLSWTDVPTKQNKDGSPMALCVDSCDLPTDGRVSTTRRSEFKDKDAYINYLETRLDNESTVNKNSTLHLMNLADKVTTLMLQRTIVDDNVSTQKNNRSVTDSRVGGDDLYTLQKTVETYMEDFEKERTDKESLLRKNKALLKEMESMKRDRVFLEANVQFYKAEARKQRQENDAHVHSGYRQNMSYHEHDQRQNTYNIQAEPVYRQDLPRYAMAQRLPKTYPLSRGVVVVDGACLDQDTTDGGFVNDGKQITSKLQSQV